MNKNDSFYKVYSPKLDLSRMKDLFETRNNPEIQKALIKADQDYLHWEDLRHKSWIPKKFFPKLEAFWSIVRLNRYINSISTPILDEAGNLFNMNIKGYSEFLHIVDKEMAGNYMGISHFSENNKMEFVKRNLIEESIASSQLEGANTSRAVAKKMLLEGRIPVNTSEQMILNNHKAMTFIEQEAYKRELSLDLIFELHRILTQKTLSEDKQGAFRSTYDENGEKLKIIPWSDTVTYITPDIEFVKKELPRLIKFANDELNHETVFIHPLLKGIMLHFWIGLLHPFEDGNGRLARILFYWYMLKHEYWAFKYISLSEKIKKSPKQYAMAYIYSEQEQNDLTYFIHYNIEKIKLAKKEFQEYIQKKMDENKVIAQLHQKNHELNERQIQLLLSFSMKKETRINLHAYQASYNVEKGTAIHDLKILLEKEFLTKIKTGRNTFYYPTDKINNLFK